MYPSSPTIKLYYGIWPDLEFQISLCEGLIIFYYYSILSKKKSLSFKKAQKYFNQSFFYIFYIVFIITNLMMADDQGLWAPYCQIHIFLFLLKKKWNEMYISFLRKDPELYHVLNQISKSDYNLNGRKLNFRMYHPQSTS